MRARWILLPLVVIAALAAAGAVYFSMHLPKPKPAAVATPERLCADRKGTLIVNPGEGARCPKDTHVFARYADGKDIAVCCAP